MTEINNINGGGQVITLQPANARDPVKAAGSIERFRDGGSSATGSEAPTKSSQASSTNQTQDPLEQAAQAIEEFIGDTGPSTKLRIDKDDETGRFVYKSVDAESGEVLKQFPPETVLEIISRFRDPEGLVLDDEA